MVRYSIMKRLTQILASVLFVLTVLTVYLAFDFAVSKALPQKQSAPPHPPDDIKFEQKSSLLSHSKTDNLSLRQGPGAVPQPRPMRSLRSTRPRVKPAPFHKSKTGIKLNQMKKSHKLDDKSSSTTTKRSLLKQMRDH